MPPSPATSPSTSPSPVTSSPSAVERYIPRDPMSSVMLFDMMTSVRARFTLVLLFRLLNHTNIQAMLNLVLKIVIIYILVLI